jgi:hypothetical protein
MELISSLQYELLTHLLCFKQLTIPQFELLLKNKYSYQTIRRNLEKLYKRRRPYINRIEYKKVTHFGKLSYVYNLKKLGLNVIEIHLDKKQSKNAFVPSSPRLTGDYFHRTRTIDFQIKLSLAEQEEDFKTIHCSHYFVYTKLASSFISVNRICTASGSHIIPDLIFIIARNDFQRLLLFELHNGNDKSRIIEQIRNHALALVSLNCHTKFRIPKNRYYYILLLFEESQVQRAVIKDIKKDIWYKDVAKFFLCKSLDQEYATFLGNWTDLYGNESAICIE